MKPGKRIQEVNFWKVITTFFWVGYFPKAPGTAGALAALLPAILILRNSAQSSLWLLILVVIFTVLGIIGSFRLEKLWGKDPQKIVVDEAVGIWISLLFLPFNWVFIVSAFALFRLFDIFKPLGINKVQKWPGGYGVMADDVLAGIATNLILQALSVMFMN